MPTPPPRHRPKPLTHRHPADPRSPSSPPPPPPPRPPTPLVPPRHPRRPRRRPHLDRTAILPGLRRNPSAARGIVPAAFGRRCLRAGRGAQVLHTVMRTIHNVVFSLLSPSPEAPLCVAPRANSSAMRPSSRLASPAPRRPRCDAGIIHGLLDNERNAVFLANGGDGEIVRYDVGSGEIERFGRRGRGPGEFGRP